MQGYIFNRILHTFISIQAGVMGYNKMTPSRVLCLLALAVIASAARYERCLHLFDDVVSTFTGPLLPPNEKQNGNGYNDNEHGYNDNGHRYNGDGQGTSSDIRHDQKSSYERERDREYDNVTDDDYERNSKKQYYEQDYVRGGGSEYGGGLEHPGGTNYGPGEGKKGDTYAKDTLTLGDRGYGGGPEHPVNNNYGTDEGKKGETVTLDGENGGGPEHPVGPDVGEKVDTVTEDKIPLGNSENGGGQEHPVDNNNGPIEGETGVTGTLGEALEQ